MENFESYWLREREREIEKDNDRATDETEH